MKSTQPYLVSQNDTMEASRDQPVLSAKGYQPVFSSESKLGRKGWISDTLILVLFAVTVAVLVWVLGSSSQREDSSASTATVIKTEENAALPSILPEEKPSDELPAIKMQGAAKAPVFEPFVTEETMQVIPENAAPKTVAPMDAEQPSLSVDDQLKILNIIKGENTP
jgi:hypothetical protein